MHCFQDALVFPNAGDGPIKAIQVPDTKNEPNLMANDAEFTVSTR